MKKRKKGKKIKQWVAAVIHLSVPTFRQPVLNVIFRSDLEGVWRGDLNCGAIKHQVLNRSRTLF